MNKIYGITWNAAQGRYVVAHEKARTGGQPNSASRAVTIAVAAACLALGATEAMAQACNGGTTITSSTAVSASVSGPCTLGVGGSLTIASGGTVTSGFSANGVDLASAVANSIINNSGGTISGGGGIFLQNATLGSIANAGKIASSPGNSIWLNSANVTGSIVNRATGTISSGNMGIQLHHGTIGGQIENAGAITAAGRAIQINASTGNPTLVSQIGGIINTGTLIGGSSAVNMATNSTVAGRIVNTGLISGAANYGLYFWAGTVTGGITNSTGGTISGGQHGIVVYGSSSIGGGITNGGTILGLANMGMRIRVNSTVSGGVTNSGAILGAFDGVFVGSAGSGSAITGGLTNSGLIRGISDYGIALSGSSIANGVTNAVAGTITGGKGGIYAHHASAISGGINNFGRIISPQTAISINASALDTIVNNVSGIVASSAMTIGYAAIKIDSTTLAGITNSGTISGVRVVVDNESSTITSIINKSGATMTSTSDRGQIIANNGTIGSILNAGTLLGTGTASNNDGAGGTPIGANSMAIANGGTINSINNSGLISMSGGSATGIYNGTGKTIGTIINSGRILVSGVGSAGIDNVGSTTSITNSGTISGTGSSSNGVYNDGSLNSLVNIGYISGSRGVNNLAGATLSSIVNTGTIAGLFAGIKNRGGAITTLVNSGLISGVTNGIKIYASGGTNGSMGALTNSGTISGGSYSVYVDDTSTLSSVHIQGTDTAKFIGAFRAPNTPVTVDAGASYTMDNGNQFTVSGFTNAGTLKIGAGSTGTITGDFTNTGRFIPIIAGSSSYGKLVVSGTADLTGSTLAVQLSGTPTVISRTLTSIIHAGAVNGNFASISGPNTLFSWTANYSATDVDLVIGAGNSGSGGSAGFRDSAVLAGTTSATSAGAVLDQISAASNGQNPVVVAFLNVPQTQVANAVGQTLPLLTGNTAVASSGALTSINRVIQARVEANRGMSSGDEFYGDKKLWFKPFASWADQGDKAGVAGYKARVGGFALGADAEVNSRTRVGAAFAYANANVNSKSTIAPQSANVDIFQVIGYGSYSLDERTEANFQVDLGNNKNEGHRDIGFASTRANAKYDSFTTHLAAGLSRSYALNEATTFVPSVRIDYTNIYDKAYRESGAGALSLNVNSRTSDELIYSIDGKVAHKLNDANTILANLGFAYDEKAKASSITAAYAGASDLSFTTNGATPSKDSIRAGLGYVHAPKDGPELTARYDVEVKQGFKNETISAKARWAF